MGATPFGYLYFAAKFRLFSESDLLSGNDHIWYIFGGYLNVQSKSIDRSIYGHFSNGYLKAKLRRFHGNIPNRDKSTLKRRLFLKVYFTFFNGHEGKKCG